MQKQAKVWVADDDSSIRWVLERALKQAGIEHQSFVDADQLLKQFASQQPDVIISDIRMPGTDGLELLAQIHETYPDLPVIITTAHSDLDSAVASYEQGAFEYLPKPFDLPDLMKRTARALEQRTTLSRKAAADDSAEIDAERDDLPMIGRTPVMQALYRTVARVMNTDLPVLIWGESGSGKSLIARAIHDFSDRRSLPFVTVTDADLADIEGPSRVLARVGGGTLMIDEIADFPQDIQARLVRMMDAPGEDAPRFMATSQSDLDAAMQEGKLRRDLYYRLSGATLEVPALRDRVEDIPLLADHFLARANPGPASPRKLSDKAAQILLKFPWPGNVRQLEHAMRQLALASQAAEITASEAEQLLGAQSGPAPMQTEADTERLGASVERHLQRYFDLHGTMLPPPGLYARILREVELPMIEIALAATAGNQAKCAALLGINRNTLRKKITDLDIEVTRGRKMM